MRLRKRHAWGAVLIFLFILPILRPQGIDWIERPTAATVHWFAEVPVLNPRLFKETPASDARPNSRSARALEREMARLWNHLLDVRMRLQQAGELGNALRAGGLDRLPRAVLCRVLRAHDAVSFRRSMLIDRGTADGLRPGLPVVVGGVYLGRVAVVHAHTALVQLVTDRQARMEVFVRTTKGRGLRGFAKRRGRKDGHDLLAIEFVRKRENVGEIHVGAPVFTANFDALVPSHLLVGRIEAVEDPDMDSMPTLTMVPEFDLDATTEVVVLRTDELVLDGGGAHDNGRGMPTPAKR